MKDEDYMRYALELAEKGCGFVNPNPMVGAVIVKEGQIIGRGYHEAYGGPHAERNALAGCSSPPAGATLYVNLEPCCHYGKNPPCTEAVIESGISRVVIGSRDPNPLVSGKGIGILRDRGIEVVDGVLEQECDRLNEVFFHYITNRTPYVVMKYAMTLDGKTAAHTGLSQWITGEEARRHVHKSRRRYAAVMVGAGTVRKDDPMLTCRLEGGRNPLRIICDTHLTIPLTSHVVATADEIPTIIATCSEDGDRIKEYETRGCRVMNTGERGGFTDLKELMGQLGEAGIDSVLLEGGSALNWSALEAGIVNRVQAYVAPKLFGGAKAYTPVAGLGVDAPDSACLLRDMRVQRLGEDWLIEGEVERHVHGNH